MANEKYKIVSLSIDPEMHETLKTSAKKLGTSVSKLVRDLVDKHLNLVVNDDEDIPVILKIPIHLKEDPEGLEQWLNAKTKAIAKALTA